MSVTAPSRMNRRPAVDVAFVLPPNEPFTSQWGGALATSQRGIARALERRGLEIVTVAPRSADPPYPVGTVYGYPSAEHSASWLTRRTLGLQRRVRGGSRYEVDKGLGKLLADRGCPRVVMSSNNTLGLLKARQSCPEVRIVLWLKNVLSPDALPGIDALRGELVLANFAVHGPLVRGCVLVGGERDRDASQRRRSRRLPAEA